ncbi:hypothetical protein F383_30337 [Gossypium arboreum]|uniref:Uncharacterized protein n=1 Tax=Gossypium arboreum TaxID=29729 RepID=A0A0B0MTG1_GOSAR|nr:hypothetical protein F383_30337 [Gossypium arboreum]
MPVYSATSRMYRTNHIT